MNSFANKTILIVGGSSGIGLATGHRVAAAGGKPILAGRSRQNLDAALTKLPVGALAEVLDFANPTSVMSLAERIGSVDHLVLSASLGRI
jgi:NADP-dependent 3-hydroxy acid dehydrogenase YdfG